MFWLSWAGRLPVLLGAFSLLPIEPLVLAAWLMLHSFLFLHL